MIIIIINKPQISVALVQDICHIRYFLQKEKLVLRSLLSEGRYFQGWGGGIAIFGICNTCDILLVLSRGRYFRNFTVSRFFFSPSVISEYKTSD